MKRVEQKFRDYIEAHSIESKKSAIEIGRAIQNSPLEYEVPGSSSAVPIYTRTVQIPKFFTKADRENFERICKTFYSIFEKTIDAYQKDASVRSLFGFDPILDGLVRQTCPYKAKIPMLRIDIFYDENTKEFKVCEFNTDGTSAMYENRMMDEFLSLNNAWNALHIDADHQELMDSWADALLEDAAQAGVQSKPAIAIVDYLENAYLPELYAFADLFKKRGSICEVVDVRDLVRKDHTLCSRRSNQAFDVIYRRAVTSDVMERLEESKDFLQAAENGEVILIGGFQTQIIHSKAISEALFSPVLRRYFTSEENAFLDAHLPASFDLTMQSAPRVLEHREKWIIKPKEGYGAKGVYAGVDLSEKNWQRLIEDQKDKGFIAQEYIPHFQSVNIDLLAHDTFMNYSNLSGLYVYNGKFAGVYSRLSDAGIVSTQYNERMVPTLFLNQDEDGQTIEDLPE